MAREHRFDPTAVTAEIIDLSESLGSRLDRDGIAMTPNESASTEGELSMTRSPGRQGVAAMLLAGRIVDWPKVTVEHERLLEKSLHLGALLRAIARGHDLTPSSDRMNHARLQALIDLAIKVRDELDAVAVTICKQLGDHEEDAP